MSAAGNSRQQAEPASRRAKLWTKAPFTNLIRYEPSGVYFARMRVQGKLIVKSLNTPVLSVAKLRLGDLERSQRQVAESQTRAKQGKMLFGEATKVLRSRIEGDVSLKPRTRTYYQWRLVALLKSWPGLGQRDVRTITKNDCLDWAAKFAAGSSGTAFNNTVSVLRRALDIAVEQGVRYDNPAAAIKRVGVRPKRLKLPEFAQFAAFVQAIETAGGRESRNCADLVRFLAFGGLRVGEARNVTWADCNFAKGEIAVRGDAETGTKNSEIRRVPMIADMVTLLARMRQERPDEPADSPVMQVRECQKAMDRAAKLVGMHRITHHDLRHLFATRCIEAGVDIPTVSRWLGHKDGGALAMKTYGHLRDEHSVNMAKKVTFGTV